MPRTGRVTLVQIVSRLHMDRFEEVFRVACDAGKSWIPVTFLPSSDDPDMGSVRIEARAVAGDVCGSGLGLYWARSEFGTRRRRSFLTQYLVVRGIMNAKDAHEWKEWFFGTSNVYLAMRYNLNVKGTIAHEWFMGANAAGTALDLWSNLYGDSLSVTLTDTLSTEFYREFDNRRANQWKALHQDSGDPKVFAPRAKRMFVWYWLTNDIKKKSSGYEEQTTALNIVIKLGSIDRKGRVKISDEITKNTGVPEVVAKVKEMYQMSVS
ncbi:Quinolinate phosphoribosyl transferase [Suillus subalutaceus]|uniref:Quinolinate phosphoribosyl transferase n=1 Tax=Suillus subalutaceus TaxID=48586 RepID=UPI001B85D9E1|nr:Quinolinate phosphoribosyl transferase [Suillus subalutaceus]KAG1843941.1 Quinolinate phosphoribosyl transferase [Suillus subalutaceus]